MVVRQKMNQGLYDTALMLRRTGKENGSGAWPYVAKLLLLPRRRRIAVNVLKLARETNPGESVIIPGKVLGTGELNHAISVSAYSFSPTARKKIVNAGGKCLSLGELAKQNPRGSGINRILR
jgi:large subunit ribosomal protein L18e